MGDRHNVIRDRVTQYLTTDHNENFFDGEISKMNDSYETLFDERVFWKQIRNLSRDIMKLDADFHKSVDNKLAQQKIRVEIQSKDEEITKLANNIIAIQEQWDYRPTVKIIVKKNMSPMEMAQRQMDDITRLTTDILKKKEDCETLKELTKQRGQLSRQLNRGGHNPNQYVHIRSEIREISNHITELEEKYYHLLQ